MIHILGELIFFYITVWPITHTHTHNIPDTNIENKKVDADFYN